MISNPGKIDLQLTADKQHNELELILLLRNRDTQVFSILFDKYAPSLNGIIISIIGQSSFSDEILREAFLSIPDKINKYDSNRDSLFSWMINITRNLTIEKKIAKNPEGDPEVLREKIYENYVRGGACAYRVA